MIKDLISSDSHAELCMALIKTMDMTTEVKQLVAALYHQSAGEPEISTKATILNLTNIHTGTVTLYYNEIGNISLKAPDSGPVPPQLYSVPGHSILFAINAESYYIQLYHLENDHLTVCDP